MACKREDLLAEKNTPLVQTAQPPLILPHSNPIALPSSSASNLDGKYTTLDFFKTFFFVYVFQVHSRLFNCHVQH